MGLDLTALTVPVFAGVWGMGWGACYVTLVKPMQARLSAMETKLATIETGKDQHIATLEKALGIGGER
jgi:hypothetical protein